MKEDFTEGEKYLITDFFSPEEEYETTQIKDDQTVQKLWNKNYVNSVLNKLSDKGFLEKKAGSPARWKLTEKAKDLREQEKRREEQLKQENTVKTEYEEEEMVDEFSKYWSKNQEQVARVEKEEKPAKLDYQELAKSFNLDLADDLIREPEKVLNAARDALQYQISGKAGRLSVRVVNLPEYDDKEVTDMTPEDKETLITVRGVLETVSKPMMQYVGGIFECVQCGDEVEYTHEPRADLNSPYTCECGGKKFEVVEEYEKSVIVATLNTEPGKQKETVPVRIEGMLASDFNDLYKKTGQPLRVTGILKYEKRQKGDDFNKPKISANSLEVGEQEWDEVEVSEEAIEWFKELKNDMGFQNWVDYVTKRYAAEVVDHQRDMKELFINGVLGSTEDPDLLNISALLLGDPGIGKSLIAGWTKQHLPRTIYSVGQGSTEVGLTASVRKDEITGAWVAEAGDIPQANNGIHITDEVDNIDDEDYSAFNEALDQNQISISKGNLSTTLQADVSEIAMGNPKKGKIDPYEDLHTQIPIKKDEIINRFDLILFVDENDTLHDREKRSDISGKIIQKYMDEQYQEDFDATAEEFSQLLVYCRRLNPKIAPKTKEKIQTYFDKLVSENSPDNESEKSKSSIGFRRVETLVLMSRVYARLDLSEEVDEKHILRAKEFFDTCLKSIDLNPVEEGVDAAEGAGMRKLKVVKQELEVLNGSNNAVEVQKLVENITESYNMTEKEAEEALDHLKSDGEIFEPESGKVKFGG